MSYVSSVPSVFGFVSRDSVGDTQLVSIFGDSSNDSDGTVFSVAFCDVFLDASEDSCGILFSVFFFVTLDFGGLTGFLCLAGSWKYL